MRSAARRAFLLAAALAAASALELPTPCEGADGPPPRREASVGYVFPAGGRRGAVVPVLLGGQNLRGVAAAHVSGTGVRAKVLRHVPPLSLQQVGELRRRIREIEAERRAEAAGQRGRAQRLREQRAAARAADRERVDLPDHPLLADLESKSAKELRAVAARFLSGSNRRQTNPQIAETVELEVTIDRDAAPGPREIRLAAPAGLTNPLRLEVGVLPEAVEEEPLDEDAAEAPAAETPLVQNGQIHPGDADRLRFRARRGRRIVVDAGARRLVPYLADAVPGWFQATVVVRDAQGHEVAYADDSASDPDPVLSFVVPEDGEYVAEVRDALWRGRDDFVYRLTVGEQPFVTRMFPLGAPAGSQRTATVAGWNLPGTTLPLDTGPEGGDVRWTAARRGDVASNPVPYAVGTLPECEESEPNDAPRDARRITTPTIVNGRIGAPGDEDLFPFEGRQGEEVVVEVEARRLHSPLDSLVSLVDAAGTVLAWNDDHEDPLAGLLTHHADSYVRARLPADGIWVVRVADAQRHGGPDHAYRLRVGPPRPAFEVLATPSGLAAGAGRTVPLRLHAVRRDGFDGAIDVRLAGAPEGFVLSGGRIPAGRTSVAATLTVPLDPAPAPVVLRLEAVARVAEVEVRRAVLPADDRMQAFAYRHLVPAQELVVAVSGARRGTASPTLVSPSPVRIPAGGTAPVRFRLAARNVPRGARFALEGAPPGLSIERSSVEGADLELVVRAASDVPPGTAENLVVEAWMEVVAPARGERRREPPPSVSLGHLPAIPFEVGAR